MPVICEKIKTEFGVFSKKELIAKTVLNNFPSIYVLLTKINVFTNLAEITLVILTLEALVKLLVNTVFL